MGLRSTAAEGTACLYDSVDDMPLRIPVFDSAEHAADFERYAAKKVSEDLRRLPRMNLEALLARWRKERFGEDGELIDETNEGERAWAQT